ncbi:MAG: hypothetical protein EBY16_08940 [Gammaproteobacteria bacterium]|nr:hypothetical protein [Gammaproteobacteria bacterium]
MARNAIPLPNVQIPIEVARNTDFVVFFYLLDDRTNQIIFRPVIKDFARGQFSREGSAGSREYTRVIRQNTGQTPDDKQLQQFALDELISRVTRADRFKSNNQFWRALVVWAWLYMRNINDRRPRQNGMLLTYLTIKPDNSVFDTFVGPNSFGNKTYIEKQRMIMELCIDSSNAMINDYLGYKMNNEYKLDFSLKITTQT